MYIFDTDTLSQWCVDFQRFQRDAALLLWLFNAVDCAHVMQAVGQLYQKNADILGHCEKELAEVFGLLALYGFAFDPV